MKLIDIFNEYKEQYPEVVVFIKSGKFYLTFDNDALIASYIFGYKKVNNKVGFPEAGREKVEAELKKQSIDYVFAEEEVAQCLDNRYYYFLKIASEDVMIKNISNTLNRLIKEKIANDFSNYEKIKRFLNEL